MVASPRFPSKGVVEDMMWRGYDELWTTAPHPYPWLINQYLKKSQLKPPPILDRMFRNLSITAGLHTDCSSIQQAIQHLRICVTLPQLISGIKQYRHTALSYSHHRSSHLLSIRLATMQSDPAVSVRDSILYPSFLADNCACALIRL